MPPGGQDSGDGERRQPLRSILDSLHFEADAGERVDDLGDAGIGLEMLTKPAQGELHAPTPPLRVGTSSAANP